MSIVESMNNGYTKVQQNNVGDVDLWLAPHKGSIATGVVCHTPLQHSLGEADRHPRN